MVLQTEDAFFFEERISFTCVHATLWICMPINRHAGMACTVCSDLDSLNHLYSVHYNFRLLSELVLKELNRVIL